MHYFSQIVMNIAVFFSAMFGAHATTPMQTAVVGGVATSTPALETSIASSTKVSSTKKPTSLFADVTGLVTSSMQNALPLPQQKTSVGVSNEVHTFSQSMSTSSSAVATSTPAAPASLGTNTIDETSAFSSTQNSGMTPITELSTTISFSGHSSSASAVTIVLADPSKDPTDWSSVSAETTAHIGTAAVSKGVWQVEWRGIPQGDYAMYVYDASSHLLLVKGMLQVTARPSFAFTSDPAVPVTLGLGQEVIDGNVTIKLNSVDANGSAILAVTDTANDGGSFSAGTFTVMQGTNLPSTGIGFDDIFVPTHARSVHVSNVSTLLKTVILTTSYVQESPRVDGRPR